MTPPSTASPLLDLRDIQVPDGVDWWPLAPGWWLLIGLLLLGMLILFSWLLRRTALCRAALKELKSIRLEYRDDPPKLAMSLNMLLKRIAQVSVPESACAGLNGDAWLAFLDRHSRGGQFPPEEGCWLLTLPYAACHQYPADPERLLRAVESWIRANT